MVGDSDDCSRLSLELINKELDQNSISNLQKLVNELVYLLNRRRALVKCKRVKLCEEFNRKLEDISKSSVEQLMGELRSMDDDMVKKLMVDSDCVTRISGCDARRRAEELSKS